MIENMPADTTLWLPTTLKEAKLRNWAEFDVILFSGDAYVDHPAFGTAVIGRVIEDEGLRIGIVPQPNWRDDLRDFKKMGTPRLFFAITGGSMDSMVNHYTAAKRRRSNDAYTPDGMAGYRPDYAVTVYSTILKKLYPDTPIVIGGVEASLRRFTHYDYWSDKLKPSILWDSRADLLVYGMGETTIRTICKLAQKGVPFVNMNTLPQIASLVKAQEIPENKQIDDIWLHSHEECLKSKTKFGENFKHIETESNKILQKRLIQPIDNFAITVNPPEKQLSEKEMDSVWDLPYTRMPHPRYHKKPPIPAYEMIRHSINSHRGCFGGCSFCTISAHQGKQVVSRSPRNIMKEVKKITEMPDFKGHITDIGGPSANMYRMKGIDLEICNKCQRPSCIYPSICSNLNADHQPLIDLYQRAQKVKGVKKITVGSGIRYDMLYDKNQNLTSKGEKYARQIIRHHVSGRLKIAPEHTSLSVLQAMRKPGFELFRKFQQFFDVENKNAGLNQQLIPYFISSHPGCTWEDMAQLSIEAQKKHFFLEPVQDFTPTPMTLATVMFYTGINPYTNKPVFSAKTQQEKQLQRNFFFWHKPLERKQITAFLKKQKRNDILNQLDNRQNMKKKQDFKKRH
ncbi:MAG: YgiQ family radical SAM protein [Salinivirgaceae bacterium]|jgi:uncharacterized radical SAM protein YgiQ|nr:YgiQ family radical SAM protein [Salinivirgaceae bacterium]